MTRLGKLKAIASVLSKFEFLLHDSSKKGDRETLALAAGERSRAV